MEMTPENEKEIMEHLKPMKEKYPWLEVLILDNTVVKSKIGLIWRLILLKIRIGTKAE